MGHVLEPGEVAVELERLRTENARLRALLGIDERQVDGHAIAWSPTLLSSSVPITPVDAESPNQAKLELFRSLFGARSDVHAVRWENTSTGRSGWSPATRGGWSSQRPSKRDYLPLTDEVFATHLRGQATVGIYPLLRGDACALLACDFDKGTWLLDALAYLDACHANGVPAALERSRSGNGGHVWVFFEAPVPASEARALGAALLRQAMASRAELDLSSYDRLFPSQDFLPKAGFGNLIALPLQGEGRAALNFSEWHTAAGEEADEAADAVGDGMPPDYYTYFGLHDESKLTPAEFQELIDGLERTTAADPPAGGD